MSAIRYEAGWVRGGFLSAVAALLLAAAGAHAATIVPNSFIDNDPGKCTLRKAVENATGISPQNPECTSGTAGTNTVSLSAGTYTVDVSATLGTNQPLNLVNFGGVAGVTGITILGASASTTIIDGQNTGHIFDNFGAPAETAITIRFQGVTITRGKATNASGFSNAGAIYVETNATAILESAVVSNNTAEGDSAAMDTRGNTTINNTTFSGNAAILDGGVTRNQGTLTITNSTFVGNSAQDGGAILQSGASAIGPLTITNSTFSGNTATGRGGAIAADGGVNGLGAISLTHVTIANNTAGSGSGGGLFNNQTAAFSFDRSIIANNTAATGPDCNGSFTSNNFNVIGNAATCTIGGTTTNNFTGAALLNPLANNGGPTQTISLQPYSPARDRAPTGNALDQRGVTRPLGTAFDSGAFEAAPTVAQAPAIGTATAGIGQATVTFTASANNGGAAITSYVATSSPSGITGSCTAPCTSITVSGLSGGTPYTFTVVAVNSVGSSAPSAASNSATPFDVPGAPTIGTATAGNAQATVSFTAPASDGGSVITSYTATSSPSGITGTCAAPCTSITVSGLANGTAYTFTVTATNAVGTGPASAASNGVVPATVPSAPTIGTATAGNAQATVTFAGSASNGGSPILGYTAISSPGAIAGTCIAPCTSITVNGLTNGTAYTFTVTATNSVGTSAASAPSNSVTPLGPPGAPTIGIATAGNAQASVAFTAPATDGGSPIVSYTATSSPSGITGSCAAPCASITVNGLANGTAYTFTVAATNAVGTGPASAPSNSVTPATIPGAPTIGIATRGNAQATVAFTAPASDGGSPITSYTAISSPSGITGSCAAPCASITVSGLTNGTAYTFTVTATNAVGTGPASAASNSVTPATVPGAPTIGTATAGNAQATVTFTAPASDGGAPITSYTATSSPSGITGSCAAPCASIPVSGLTNGTAYTFTVTANNAVGASAPSAASNSVTPVTVPGAPTIGIATAGNAQATVNFTAPASNGGSAITSYTATSSPSGITGTCAAPCTSITVSGLTNGTAYTFTVTATSAVGTSAPSAASNSVTPATLPGAPTIGTATGGNAQAAVTFTAPASNGGSAITSYTATSSPSGITGSCAAPCASITVTGLTNGTAYTFTVTATNGVGTGPASAASNSVTPATVPGAPTIGAATAGNAQATVTFTAPASNGGSAITSFTATSSPSGITGSCAAPCTSITVSGLANGTAYTFTVTATNAIGTGAASAASNSVTPATVPGAPTIGTATPGNAQATVAFTAPASNGGSAITSFTATSSPSGITGTCAAPCTSITVTGLTNGTAYTFTVAATNALGTSAASAPSNSVTPATLPGAPTIGTATAGNAQATVAFTAPASTGGSAITSYTATSSPSAITGSCTAPCTSITVTGLANGTAYTFTVKATNAVGAGPASAASNSVTPATVPGAPTIGTATRGNAQAMVTFTAPASDGGSAITSYTATSSPSGITGTCAAPCTSITVAGLANGTAYTFTVKATNALGAGPASAASNSVTPATLPGAPTIGTATPGNGQATIAFTAPASDGGSPITSYAVTCDPGAFSASGAASPITVTGLANGTAYTCSVAATNAVGTGAASASVAVTPSFDSYTAPSATGSGIITAAFTGGGPTCAYATAQFIAAPPGTGRVPSVAPPNVVFPDGLFDFSTTGCTAGATLQFTITYPAPLPPGTQYWKYGPTAADPAPHWYVLPAIVTGNVAKFSIADGGLGDDDLTVNGVVVDQGGPGAPGAPVLPRDIPTLGEWAMALLGLLLASIGVARSRTR